jgi:hypothetical protein
MRASTHRCVKLVYTLPCPTPCCLRTAAAAAVGATGSGVHSAADSPPWGALSQVGVRELLVQCVENVLRSHWAALGRGWHSAFEFIAAAGRDPARSVAALALRCVAPAPAALFAAVPAECVADCVHALAAFAANPHHLALRSVVCCEPCEWESTSERETVPQSCAQETAECWSTAGRHTHLYACLLREGRCRGWAGRGRVFFTSILQLLGLQHRRSTLHQLGTDFYLHTRGAARAVWMRWTAWRRAGTACSRWCTPPWLQRRRRW